MFTGSTNCSTGAGSSTTITNVGNPSPHTFALNPGDSVTLKAPQVSNQNGLFQSWVSPDGELFTSLPEQTICVQGDASAHTYVAVYNPGLVVLDNTCTTPKTLFNLGETVCVKVFAQPAAIFGKIRVQFLDPEGATRNDPSMFVISSDQQTFTFTLPATNTTGPTDNRGTWTARIVNDTNALSNNALFLVHNPTSGQEAADVRVTKGAFVSTVPPNGTIQYDIRLGNSGPDPAPSATLTDTVPTDTTLFSFQQLSGPSFNCNAPAVGGTGNISCTGSLPVLALDTVLTDPVNAAVFRLVVKVNNGVPNGTIITNTANSSSTTFDTRTNNNMSTATTTVQASACSLTCPADIATAADTTCGGSPGKVVMFPNPTTVGTCGAIMCSPPSSSCFPVGTTTVTCQENNALCNFRVTVSPGCALTCPADITKANDPGQRGAVTTFATPSDAGCGTVTCSPASGSFFPVGTTTVTCTPTTGSSCTFTITVQDTQPPTITCPAPVVGATPQNVCSNAGCSVVNFPPPTVLDNCPGTTSMCTPPSGSCFPTGLTTVTCTATDAAGNTATCSFTVTVFDVCLQDDSNSQNTLSFNSQTGSYRFCCGGMTFTGTGTVLVKGCTISLSHNASDRRVNALVEKTQFRGNASLQSPPGSLKCTILDRDIRNNACTCP